MAVQYADIGAEEEPPPSRRQVRSLLRAALPNGGEVAVRFVSAAAMKDLNLRHRRKAQATNVLSFSYLCENGGAENFSDDKVRGDIAICPAEARKGAHHFGLPPSQHLAHLIVHAALHLRGKHHDTAAAARAMEAEEAAILARFKIADPYRQTNQKGGDDAGKH